MLIAFLAAFELDDRARRFCSDVREAMRRANLSSKEVAITIRAREQKLSDQLNGRRPFTLFQRFTLLPDAFWHAWDDVRAERRGALLLKQPELVSMLSIVKAQFSDRELA